MKLKRILFLLFFIPLIFAQCNENIKIIKNKETIYIQTNSFPITTTLEIGNPNCFPLKAEIICKVPYLNCSIVPNYVLLLPGRTQTIKITVYGEIKNSSYLGKVIVKYSAGDLSIDVPYNLKIKILKISMSSRAFSNLEFVSKYIYYLGFGIAILILAILSRSTRFKLLWIKLRLWILKRRF